MERAARIYQYGPPEVLQIEPIEVPVPGPGEALVRHTAIGLNFVEVYFRRGTFQMPVLPAVLGNEGAGIVEAIGPGVEDVAVGDRVVYADSPIGAYATVRLYPADQLVRIPAAVSDEQAAASFLRGVTARMLLKDVVPLHPGDTVLYHAQPEASACCSRNGRGRSASASSVRYPMPKKQLPRALPAASRRSTIARKTSSSRSRRSPVVKVLPPCSIPSARTRS